MPVYDPAKNEMARRMSMQPGATPGGLSPGMGSPPPPPGQGGQLPQGAAPPSRLTPLLQQVMQILVEGQQEDLMAFGEFQAQLAELVQSHQAGLGPQGQPPMPGGGMPQQGGMPPGGGIPGQAPPMR